MKKTVLVAEDNIVNRKILHKLLDADYTVLEAADGKQALALMERSASFLSAVLLDIGMPVMDGFAVLKAIGTQPALQNIPVLVLTGSDDKAHEVYALQLGAWDFVTKPYDAQILQFRLHNAIARSQLNLLEQLRYQAEFDQETGLFNTQKFCQDTRQLLDACPEEPFAVLCLVIQRFKQFRSFFGVEESTRLLVHTADALRRLAAQQPHCVYARTETAAFSLCLPCPDATALAGQIATLQESIRRYSSSYDLIANCGIYRVDDRALPVSEMLDRASLAARSCKGSYQKAVAQYTEELGRSILREKEITSEMHRALEQGQFCLYFQPKYNIASGRPCGAEALVRWMHPQKGLVPPGIFIPVFERNGFVTTLDFFVWESACRYLKKWSDAGFRPAPVSVNISRVSLSNPKIVEIIAALVQKYGIPPRLLQLEITESAYMDNPGIMEKVVDGFHANGFTVLMDDFGSGYSSLNTLKEIPVDILKVDMKFLPTEENSAKSEKILASVIRMADWIGMPVIVEGVETQTQRDFLQSIGCLFVQGYYYSRPVPAPDYEKLIEHGQDAPVFIRDSNAQRPDLDALLSSDPKTEALLRGISIPVGIYDYENGNYDRIRANQSFFETFGYRGSTIHIAPSESEKLCGAFLRAAQQESTSDCEILTIRPDGMACWYRVNVRYIMPSSRGHILCAVFTDITDTRRVQSEMTRIVGVLNESALPKRIMLIADDSELSRALLRTMFAADFRILEAKNGREALDLLSIRTDEISIILLDMIMPEMDGTEFLARKARMESAALVPVVIISAENSQDIQVSTLHSGVSDYITKPFVPEVVQQRIHNVIDYQTRFGGLIRQYRQTIALSPAVSAGLLNSCVSLPEARALVAIISPVFDIVRLVDPQNTCVLTITEDGELQRAPYTCFKVWNKETRCENCTSSCAQRTGCQMTKYEFIDNNIFYVVSRPITILPDGEAAPIRAVLEIVSHVSDSVLMQEYDGVPVRKLMETTRSKIYTDPLTGAFNRRYLYEFLFLHRGRPDITPLVALIMLDMDHFKQINDTCGHTCGDRVLADTVQALRQELRPCDSLIRYGGDEFLILLTGCDRVYAETMLAQFAQAVATVHYGEIPEQTASARFGCAYTDAFESTREFLDNMIAQADKQMYGQKHRLPGEVD